MSVNSIMNGMKYFQSWKKEEKFCTTWKIKQNPIINARMEPQSSALSPYLFIQHKLLNMYHILVSDKNSECIEVNRQMTKILSTMMLWDNILVH